jgi:small conductance mechanosensitive channel
MTWLPIFAHRPAARPSVLAILGLCVGLAGSALTLPDGRLHAQEGQDSQQVADSAAADSLPAEEPQEPPELTDLERARVIADSLLVARDSLEASIVEFPEMDPAAAQVRRIQAFRWLEEARTLIADLADLMTAMEQARIEAGRAEADTAGDEPAEDLSDEEQAEREAAEQAEAEAAEADAAMRAGIRSDLRGVMDWMDTRYRDAVQVNMDSRDSLQVRLDDATGEEEARIESQIRMHRSRLDTLLYLQEELLENAESMGVDVGADWRRLEQELVSRADGLVGALQLTLVDRSSLRTELRDAQRAGLSDAELSRIRTSIQARTRRIETLAYTLEATADLLDRRGYNTAPYRQLVIQSTGEVTGDILNVEVLKGILADMARAVVSWIERNGPTVFVRLLIVLVAIWLTRWAIRFLWWGIQLLGFVKLPRLAKDLVGRSLGPVGIIIGLGVGLTAIGVDTTTVLAGVGVLGVVVGFALQDSLANLAAGFFILVYQPYDVDDVIEVAGIVGTVRTMGLANTTLLTFDNRRLSIPNSKVWQNIIANRSAEPRRRAEAVIRIGLAEDVSRVQEVVLDALGAHELVLDDPAPSSHVAEAGASWLDLKVWAWTRNEDWWTITAALPAVLKAAFEEAGIEIPVPRQELTGWTDQPSTGSVTPSEPTPSDRPGPAASDP